MPMSNPTEQVDAVKEAREPSRYQILSAGTIKELEIAVRIAMLSDWEPLGGVAVDDELMYQAMVPKGD